MRGLVAVLIAAGCGSANAEERLYGSFIYNSDIPNALFFMDEIKNGDDFELRKALRNHNIDTIVSALSSALARRASRSATFSSRFFFSRSATALPPELKDIGRTENKKKLSTGESTSLKRMPCVPNIRLIWVQTGYNLPWYTSQAIVIKQV